MLFAVLWCVPSERDPVIRLHMGDLSRIHSRSSETQRNSHADVSVRCLPAAHAMLRYYAHSATIRVTELTAHSLVYLAESNDDTVQHLVDAFRADYVQQHKVDVIVDDSAPDPLTTELGEPLLPSDRLSSVLPDRGDLLIALKAVLPPAHAPAAQPVRAVTTKVSTPAPTVAKASPAPVEEASAVLTESERAAAAQLEEATKAHSDGRLAKALQLYDAVLSATSTSPIEREPTRLLRKRALSQSGVVHVLNRRWEAASKRFEKAVQLTSLTYRLVTSTSPARLQQKDEQIRDDAELFTLLARCYLHMREWEEAELALTKAKELLAQIKGAKGVANTLRDLDVLRVQALIDSGDERKRSEGVTLIEALIKANDQHVPSLVRYAKVAIDGGQTLPTIPYLLRAVVNLQQKKNAVDDDTRDLALSLFASTVSLSGGVEELFASLGQAADIPASLVFLAQTLKDRSAIAAAIACYRRAAERTLDADVEKAGIVLNLVHTIELTMDYPAAWKELRRWMAANKNKSVGALKVADFWEQVKGIDDIRDSALLMGTAPYCAQWRDVPAPADEGQLQVAVPPADEAVSMAKGSSAASIIRPHAEYSPEALNILALMFTAVKLLFVCGGLQPLPALIALVEPVRVHKALHLTLIRNEHAYHSTIMQILRHVAVHMPSIPPSRHILFVGDSHCLSSAWSIINVPSRSSARPQPHLLRPILVTGTKIWHLRPSCTFYPHANYTSALRTLPPRSTVVLTFGEIDCREGLLTAVAKAKYDSLTEAITALLDIYQAEWERLTRDGHSVWVHPVQPVLDATRPVVRQFEEALRKRVRTAGVKDVRFLNLFDDLLTRDGAFNVKEYGMDGTHINPKYVRLIEREMSVPQS